MPIFRQPKAEHIVSQRSLSLLERQQLYDHEVRYNTHVGLLVAVIIGILVILLHCFSLAHGAASAYLAAFGTALAAYGASLGLGGVLGFLFGVPNQSRGTTNNITNAGPGTVALTTGKDSVNAGGDIDTKPKPPAGVPALLEDAQPAAPAPTDVPPANVPDPAPARLPAPPASPTTSSSNGESSNLEQVADWVTKLLLGGGLTQMQRIPPKIWQWSNHVAVGMLPPRSAAEAIVTQQAFAAGLLVYGFVLGFFAGFLVTKLQLGKAIAADPGNP